MAAHYVPSTKSHFAQGRCRSRSIQRGKAGRPTARIYGSESGCAHLAAAVRDLLSPTGPFNTKSDLRQRLSGRGGSRPPDDRLSHASRADELVFASSFVTTTMAGSRCRCQIRKHDVPTGCALKRMAGAKQGERAACRLIEEMSGQ